jgi:hypothetical protein
MSYAAYAMFSFYYFNINREIGVDMSTFIGTFILFSKFFMLLFTNHLFLSTIIFTMSWAAQFAGHFIWEKNSPALLTSLKDAFTIAPLFCFMELEKDYKITNKVEFIMQVFLGYMKKQYDNLSNKHIEDRLGRDVIERSSEGEGESDSTISDNEEDEDNESNKSDNNSDVENNSDNESNKSGNNSDVENTESKKEV